MFKAIGKFIGAVMVSIYDAYKQASDTTKTAQEYLRGKCLYITQNEALIIPGEYKESMRYFEPRGVKRWFRVKKRYFLKPDNEPLVICYEGHTDTLEIGNVPELEHVTRKRRNAAPTADVDESEIDVEELKKAGVEVEPVDFEEYELKGASILSDATMELMDNILLKFIKTYPNWQVILIAIIGMLVGIFIGAIGMALLGLIFVFMVL